MTSEGASTDRMDRGELASRLGVTVAAGAIVGANVIRGDGWFLLFLPVLALSGLESVFGRVVADGMGVLHVRRAVRTYAIPVSAVDRVSAPARGQALLLPENRETRLGDILKGRPEKWSQSGDPSMRNLSGSPRCYFNKYSLNLLKT